MIDAIALQLGYWTLSAIIALGLLSPTIICYFILDRKGSVKDEENR